MILCEKLMNILTAKMIWKSLPLCLIHLCSFILALQARAAIKRFASSVKRVVGMSQRVDLVNNIMKLQEALTYCRVLAVNVNLSKVKDVLK